MCGVTFAAADDDDAESADENADDGACATGRRANGFLQLDGGLQARTENMGGTVADASVATAVAARAAVDRHGPWLVLVDAVFFFLLYGLV